MAEEPVATAGELAGVPIAFTVGRVFDLAAEGERFGGYTLKESVVAHPYVKDYDAIPGQSPADWARQFDLSHWFFIGARSEGRLIGGAVVACRTAGVDMLEGRDDLALLWNIRVAPEHRGHAVGTALFRAAEAGAKQRGLRELKVETQNNNVSACRFYARQGCRLDRVIPHAYPEFPDELQMIWRKPF